MSASTTAKASGKLIAISAAELRNLFQEEPALGLLMMRQVALTLRDRLAATRIQLAARG